MPTEDSGESSHAVNEQTSAGESAEEALEAVVESPDLVPVVERLAGEVAGLRAEFAAKIRYDEVKERQIASMHDELQQFRAGLYLRLLEPLLTDLIGMHDDLADALNGGNAAAGELKTVQKTILQSLARNGVTSYSLDSDEVDRSRQRVISAEVTEDETLDRHVRKSLRVGFEYENAKVLRPEWVVAYRYRRNADAIAAVPATEGE